MRHDRNAVARSRCATACLLFVVFALYLAPSASALQAVDEAWTSDLVLERPVRPWEFISALGSRAALLGNEGGTFEAWVYPLKILRNFSLRFKVDGQVIEGNTLARSISVRPQSTTITYAWDTFSVREILFVPLNEPGAIVQLEIDATKPVQLEAVFQKDFQIEWPGAMGGTDIDWNASLHAFALGDNQGNFRALVGSPSAIENHQEYSTNYSASKENSLGFGVIPAGHTSIPIILAASFSSLAPAETTYRKLASSYSGMYEAAAVYYRNYLAQLMNVELPDPILQKAYEWAQVSVRQGLVTNPYLGTGLVAGFRTSGEDQRPGYAWFFGRDALWTALALDAEGDYATAKSTLEFLSKYQRNDGKLPHEISQAASFVPWFQSMPYAYAAADATPLYIIAMNDYLQHSGDTAFAAGKWDTIWRAYKFMVSTYGKDDLPRNEGIGHGWVEDGPLRNVRIEFYQAGLATEALRALADVAGALGKSDIHDDALKQFAAKKELVNGRFWLPDQHRYGFAVNPTGSLNPTLSVLATVPMWFGLPEQEKASATIAQLNSPTIDTDWGMRIIPNTAPEYDSSGYHSGAVWPLFTGWASVAEYRYHDAASAFANLRTNALLTFDGSLGHVTEVLAGSYAQTLATGSPQQVWSSAMVISPLLTGLFGLDVNAAANRVSLTPHVPANWPTYKLNHIQAGSCLLDLQFHRSGERSILEVSRREGKVCDLIYSPSFSPRAQIENVEVNGRSIPYHLQQNAADQHVVMHLEVTEPLDRVVVRVRNDFGLSQGLDLPPLGSTNQGMRIVAEAWSEDREKLTVDLAAAVPGTHELLVTNAGQIMQVEGGELVRSESRESHDATLKIVFDAKEGRGEMHKGIVLHFTALQHTFHSSAAVDSFSKDNLSVH